MSASEPPAEFEPSSRGPGEPGESPEEQAASLERVERGGIPLAAERRLRELGEHGGAFTSDLSVADFALCHQLGLKPVSQVMGSSLYQVGYQSSWGRSGSFGFSPTGSFMFELETLSEALNEVRSRALARLAEEARHVGADAVVGVSARTSESDLETGSTTLEHVVVGTAVRRTGSSAGEPVLSELSVAEFAKLIQAGFEPAGIVAWSAVFFAGFGLGMGVGMGEMMGGPMQTFELREFTQAFYEARETVMAQLSDQAASLRASGVVGVKISHNAVRHALGGGNRERSGLMVTFNAVGTAIRAGKSLPLYPPETTIDLTAWARARA